MPDELIVSVDINGRTIQAGTAYFTHRGSLATSFQYSSDYLRMPGAYELDPALPLYQGQHHVSGLPGAFADCAPDRWGQNLVKRRLQILDQANKSMPRALTPVDFLVGVSDLTRQGALRFAEPNTDEFLNPDATVPKLIELPSLLRASDHIARDDADFSDLKILLAAGTATLGGARPKASVRDEDRLCIAKFPHHADSWDVMAWEKTVLDLAEAAGITTPARTLRRIDGRGVLILDRFDRVHGQRLGYISAMTMLQARDGQGHDYLDLAETIPEHSAQAKLDLRDLWRRIAFSVAIHNTDDHLRNHGFIRNAGGWRLAPLFDVNPNPEIAEHRTTSIAGVTGRDDEVEALMAAADAFDLPPDDAADILGEVLAATANWVDVAAVNGISTSERKRFAPAFEELRPAMDRRSRPL
ncbi:type II toxin-antitoxin system HipA family toxin [Nocardia sp. NPDC058640]|uniref:type II toxin-antitoxin system HipA family toxin n=1 Tax=Nocardia sp. NPDC058640 TaxID=3346571 RepID=UPI003646E9B9